MQNTHYINNWVVQHQTQRETIKSQQHSNHTLRPQTVRNKNAKKTRANKRKKHNFENKIRVCDQIMRNWLACFFLCFLALWASASCGVGARFWGFFFTMLGLYTQPMCALRIYTTHMRVACIHNTHVRHLKSR